MPKAVADDVTAEDMAPRTVRYLESLAIVSLAGQAAAERYRGRRGNFGSAVYARHPEHEQVIVGGDQHHAREVLERVAGGDPEETSLLWHLVAYRARRLVRARWPLIEKLAAALIERHELTADEVREVLLPELSPAKYQTSIRSGNDHDK